MLNAASDRRCRRTVFGSASTLLSKRASAIENGTRTRPTQWSGYIGPIGDDLPSLIPLIFALVIFFASFQGALQKFDTRNGLFADDLDALKVARILRGSGYWVSEADFHKACVLLNVRAIKYVAGLTELNAQLQDNDGSFFDADQLFIKDNKSRNSPSYECSNAEISELQKQENILVRIYPLAVEFQRENDLGIIAKPVQLVVVSWR